MIKFFRLWIGLSLSCVLPLNLWAQDSLAVKQNFARIEAKIDSARLQEAAQQLDALMERSLAQDDHEVYLRAANRLTWVRMELSDGPGAKACLDSSRHWLEARPGTARPQRVHWHRLQGRWYQRMGKQDSAQLSFEQALALVAEYWPEGHPIEAHVHDGLGEVFIRRSQLHQAHQTLEHSLAIRKRFFSFPHRLLGRSHLQVGFLEGELGRHETQHHHLLQAQAHWEATLPKQNPEWLMFYNNFGDCLGELGQFQAQIDYTERALALARKALGEKTLTTAVMYNNLGVLYDEKGDSRQGMIYKKHALSTFQEIFQGDHPTLAAMKSNLAYSALAQGDVTAALEYGREVIAMRKRLYAAPSAQLAESFNNMGDAYYFLKQYEEALAWKQKALQEIKHAVGEQHELTGLFYHNVAQVLIELGQRDAARPLLMKGTRILVEVLSPRHHKTASAYLAMGTFLREERAYAQAKTWLDKALDALHEQFGAHHPKLAATYQEMALSAEAQGRLTEAQQYMQQMLQALSLGWETTSLTENPPPGSLPLITATAEHLMAKATFFHRQYAADSSEVRWLEHALATYQAVDASLRRQRLVLMSAHSRQALHEVFPTLYEQAISAAWELYQRKGQDHYIEQAFALAESSKNNMLYEAMRESGARTFAGVPDSIQQQEQQILVDWAYAEQKWLNSQAGDSTQAKESWLARMNGYREAHESLIRTIEIQYPAYYQLKYAQQTPQLSEIQALLPDAETALIEYACGQKLSFGFVITQDQVSMLPLPGLADNDTLLQQFLELLYRPDLADARGKDPVLFTRYQQLATRLYEQWLAPALGTISASRLYLIPDASLNYLPFDLLLEPGPMQDKVNYGALPYLLQRYTIHYGYGARTLLAHTASGVSHQERYLGFAPAYGDPDRLWAYRDGNKLRDQAHKSLGFLPGNQPEVAEVAKLWRGQAWLGDQATESRFKTEAVRGQVLHLAMHTVLDEAEPRYSGLVFAPPKDSSQDGFLYAGEIYTLNLPNELVVLSACQTGYGQWQRGEGVMNLARAFRYAGCRNVVMSLWQADDQATRQVMRQYFTMLKQGLGKAEALREAKLQVLARSDRKHPHYWAAFVLVGDDLPLEVSDSGSLYWIIGLLVVALIGVGLFLRPRRQFQQQG